mmetsp:Transcript_37939/g.45743  ORF Transcript_37939/g.45743 Transcript_37939/m.45743 type:complete len:426 (-) Transcript_37939:251-1528(-)|eukprot:CAMPEP_0197849724 /NCGR_PEP_ID=MMETSP1438-20131217/13007_1 /TAXON_ID=1461541 /ORGANISM="Pterosperma sp., Strain CCMP1384" /LENGTH=425 /DNA_ID=CAMNT_0043462535 /DNA_START=113 /DNA_END=1390 /DNA_ORIENTATION=+
MEENKGPSPYTPGRVLQAPEQSASAPSTASIAASVLVAVVLTTTLTTALCFVVVQGRVDNLYDRLQTDASAPAVAHAPAPAPAHAPSVTVNVPVSVPAAAPAPAHTPADDHTPAEAEEHHFSIGENPCHGKKPIHSNAAGDDNYFKNVQCLENGVFQTLEQSGTNVTVGYKGEVDATGRTPILTTYKEAGLCPVNVHWHLGTEHLSVGQYDENGKGPKAKSYRRSLLAGDVRKGFQCMHYDDKDEKFTKEFTWEHCVGMHVGETYEVHWPHSAAGECVPSGTVTPWQYQTPFYDGVFCNGGIISLDPLNTFEKIGVQAQIFTIVNDEDYYYPDLFRGMIVDSTHGVDMAKYTGSTTGTSRDNEVCSRYTPITWQVDRKCHMVSASSFDKMCADMKLQADDMSDDLHAHGSRELVATKFAADNHQK